jgi:outer membrane protein OmpA-like peptidoglycan-associated protein
MHPIPVLSIACLLVAASAPAQTKIGAPATTNQAPTRTMSSSELMKTLNERGVAAIDGIEFEGATGTLTPASGASLKVIAAALQSDATLKLNIQDHTAAAGSRAANQALSEARAAAIRDMLIRTFAIAPDRLTATGLGDTDPIPGTRAGERPRTERVEIVKRANKTGGSQDTSTTRGSAEWTGRVQTGMMAVGGETTGIVLTVGNERFELQAADESMRRQLGDLNGKTATIRGTLEVRPGVEVQSRRIITVSEIVPNR